MTQSTRDLTLAGMTLRNLYRQRMRTMLTALGVAVGTASIVAFGSIARGLWASTQASLRFNQGDLMVFQRGVSADIFSSLDERETTTALLADPAVERVTPALWQVMPVWPSPFCFIMGLPIEEVQRNADRIVAGRAIVSANEVVLGAVAAKTLRRVVGEKVQISHRVFTIVGIFETDVVFFNAAIVVPLPSLQEVCKKTDQVTNFQVMLKPGVDPREAATRMERTNAKVVAIAGADQYKKVDQGLEIANSVVGVIGFLSIVLGGVIVMNTMWMSVHERTREIGVLRALGWPSRRIVTMVMIEATGVGLLAWVIGSFGGVGLAMLAARLPIADQFVDPVFDWQPFAWALAVAVVLSALGGSLPAWRASRISPVEALRYE